MPIFAHAARALSLVAAIGCGADVACGHPPSPGGSVKPDTSDAPADRPAGVMAGNVMSTHGSPRLAALIPNRHDDGQERMPATTEPFGSPSKAARPSETTAKWIELQTRIRSEEATLAACRSNNGNCSAGARRFLEIVELGHKHHGRARLGEINRAVNVSIRPLSDRAQYGVDDFWASPLATLEAKAGDCEDYAIVKYVALLRSGTIPDDLRFVIVHDRRRNIDHAVVAVRLDEAWLILDNRHLILVNAEEARHYAPLLVLDHRGVRELAAAGPPHG
jgi:predicted transglutaminase-like cysteine proteinase